MSTKIYDGLIAVDADVFTVATRIREVLEASFIAKFIEMFKELEELPKGSTWDDTPHGMFRGKEEIEGHSLDFRLYQKIEELDKSKVWTFSDADIMYQVVILPNMAGGNPLVMIFGGESRKHIKTVIDAGIVKDYGYWDNSDSPEDVTDEEWEVRKKAWSSIYEKSPVEVGVGFGSPSSMQCALAVIPKWN